MNKSIPRSISNQSNARKKANTKNYHNIPRKQSSDEAASDPFSFTEYFNRASDDLQTVRVTIPRVERDAKGEYAFVVAVESSIGKCQNMLNES